MKETNAFWVDKNDQPVAIAKFLNKVITVGIKLYGLFKSFRKTKRNT